MMKFRQAILLSALLFTANSQAAPSLLNGVAVIVNSEVITYQQVEDAVMPVVELLRRQYGRQPQVFEQKLNEVRRERLNELVERQLILHEFNTAGYQLPESVIEDEIQRRIREQFGDRLKLTKTLQREGRTYEGFKKDIKEQFIVSAMRSRNVSSELIISPYKIEKYYQENLEQFKLGDQVKLRMIYLNSPTEAQAESTKKLADEIHAKLKEGAAFAEMASVYSTGSQRSQGGDWGWVEKSVLREDLAEAAFKLKAGELSDVIVRPDGCYIMLVEDVKASHHKALADVRDEIEKRFRAQEVERLNKQWIDRLKTKSFIRYY